MLKLSCFYSRIICITLGKGKGMSEHSFGSCNEVLRCFSFVAENLSEGLKWYDIK